MNRLTRRIIMVLCGLLTLCSVMGAYKGNSDGNNDPLSNLTKKQKEHYKAYLALAELQQKKISYNRAAAIEETFGEVREWCQIVGPKYRDDSIKAGDKAKESENERHKKQLLQRSATYAELYDACVKIVKSFDSREIAFVEKALEQYKSAETMARNNEIQVIKREWLCYSEFTTLFMKEFKAKKRSADQEKRAEPAADTAARKTRGKTDKKNIKKN